MTKDTTPIDSRELDPNFKFEIAAEEGGEGILHCFACGSCTIRCPEQEVNPEYNPREIIHKALLGLKDEVFRSEFVWICSSHYLCLSRCPQDVNIKAVMNAVRNCRIKDETLNRDAGIELASEAIETVDTALKHRIVAQVCGADLFHCFACGACTANCPERVLDDEYSPRRVIRQILLGLKNDVYANKFIDICSTHFRCLNECPQKVEIPKLMTAIRRLAERAGYTREGRKIVKAPEDEKERRKKLKKGQVARVFVK